MENKYNRKSPAVKRLMREAIELREPTFMYHAQPLEDNLFEWHFTIIGSKGTDYEGGRYHGRIILPTEYPMKPPSIIMLTPNGRFELHQKICLSASSYHPELWQPSWSSKPFTLTWFLFVPHLFDVFCALLLNGAFLQVRTVLLAIIGFMPSDGLGSVGSLECPAEERQRMAKRSGSWTCPECGVPNKDILPEATEGNAQQLSSLEEEASQIATQMAFQSEAEVKAAKARLQQEQAQSKCAPEPTPLTTPSPSTSQHEDLASQQERRAPISEGHFSADPPQSPDLRHRQTAAQREEPVAQVHVREGALAAEPVGGTVSYVIMWLLIVAIAGLLLRRLLYS